MDARQVIINGKWVKQVQPNLHAALSQLIRSHPDRVHRIWVDALCIDQFNFDERANQVRLMSDIYRASDTIVWLGEHDQDSERAVDVLHVIHDYEDMHKGKSSKGRSVNWEDPNTYHLLGLRFIAPEEWKAVAQLLRRNWFTRVWTFQVCTSEVQYRKSSSL